MRKEIAAVMGGLAGFCLTTEEQKVTIEQSHPHTHDSIPFGIPVMFYAAPNPITTLLTCSRIDRHTSHLRGATALGGACTEGSR